MAGPKVADRVKETSTTEGTGTYDLGGAATGFQTFVAGVGTGNTCYYCATDGTDWEVGIGTVTDAATDTLSRDTILASSNAGAAVNWGVGTRDVFVTIPAGAAGGSVAEGEYTPTGSWTTNVTYSGEYEIRRTRTGYMLNAKIRISCTGAPSPTGNLLVNFLPSGWSLDSTRFAAGSSWMLVGDGMIDDVGVATRGPLFLLLSSSTQIQPQYLSATSTLNPVTHAVPLALGNLDKIILSVRDVPVV